jgi:hypothetical protein
MDDFFSLQIAFFFVFLFIRQNQVSFFVPLFIPTELIENISKKKKKKISFKSKIWRIKISFSSINGI